MSSLSAHQDADAGICQVTSSREEEEEEERFSAITYHRLNGKNITGEKHRVFLHLCPLVLEGTGEKGKAFLERGVHCTLLEKRIPLILLLLLQPATAPAAMERHKPSRSFNNICRDCCVSAGAATPWGRNSRSSSARG